MKFNCDKLDNFKATVYKPYLENVIENLHDRFPDNPVLDALSLFDPDLLTAEDPTHNEWIQHNKLKVHNSNTNFKSVIIFFALLSSIKLIDIFYQSEKKTKKTI